MVHCSIGVLGLHWSVQLVGVLHYCDWLHRKKQGLLSLGSEQFHKILVVQKGHGRLFVAFPPLCCKPHSVWVAVLFVCPCGCQKDGSWLPPGVYSAGWPHSPPAGALGREQTRIPPQDPSWIPVSYVANWAVLWLRRNDQYWREFHETLNSKMKPEPHNESVPQNNILKTLRTSKKYLLDGRLFQTY